MLRSNGEYRDLAGPRPNAAWDSRKEGLKKVIKVFISDASEDFRTLLADAIGREEDMCVCGMAEDGTEALAGLREEAPDVLVTDLILRRMDGLELLKRLRDENCPVRTVVVSGFFSDRVIASLSCLGVDYFIPKPCGTQEILRRVRELAGLRERTLPPVKEFDPLISEALINFGVMPHHQGYRYLRESIRRTMLDPNTLRGVTKILYPELAKETHSTALNVERAIRHAIKTAWERGDAARRDRYFGDAIHFDSKPSNSTLIALLAEFVLQRVFSEEISL